MCTRVMTAYLPRMNADETIMREINWLPQRCLWLLHLVINEVKNWIRVTLAARMRRCTAAITRAGRYDAICIRVVTERCAAILASC